MKTLFIRALKAEDKESALKNAVSLVSRGEKSDITFSLDPAAFSLVPNSPFAYWVDDEIRGLFKKFPPFESEGRTVKQGLATADDFRFVRAWWEVPPEHRLNACNGPDWRADLSVFQDWCHRRTCEGKYWAPFAKGGEYSPYYADIHLVVNWKDDGEEIKNNLNSSGGVRSNVWMLKDTEKISFFRPGVTWPLRTNSRIGPFPLPSGAVFSHKGPCAFFPKEDLYGGLALFFSSIEFELIELSMAGGDETQSGAPSRSYEVGLVQSLPYQRLGQKIQEMAQSVAERKRENCSSNEPELNQSGSKRIGFEHYMREIERMHQSMKDFLTIERDIPLGFSLKTVMSTELEQRQGPPVDRQLGIEFTALFAGSVYDIIRKLRERDSGDRSVSVNSFFVSRRIELLQKYFSLSIDQVFEEIRSRATIPTEERNDIASGCLSFLVGLSTAASISASHSILLLPPRWPIPSIRCRFARPPCSLGPMAFLPGKTISQARHGFAQGQTQ